MRCDDFHKKISAGFETSSTAMTYSLFELSQNQEVQDKARESVRKVLEQHEGLFTYEAMMDMHYIENCISGNKRDKLRCEIIFFTFTQHRIAEKIPAGY